MKEGGKIPISVKVDNKKDAVMVSCPLCDVLVELEETRNGNPTFWCGACGFRGFINRDAGVEKLKALKMKND